MGVTYISSWLLIGVGGVEDLLLISSRILWGILAGVWLDLILWNILKVLTILLHETNVVEGYSMNAIESYVYILWYFAINIWEIIFSTRHKCTWVLCN